MGEQLGPDKFVNACKHPNWYSRRPLTLPRYRPLPVQWPGMRQHEESQEGYLPANDARTLERMHRLLKMCA
jgi:hypothetical protein